MRTILVKGFINSELEVHSICMIPVTTIKLNTAGCTAFAVHHALGSNLEEPLILNEFNPKRLVGTYVGYSTGFSYFISGIMPRGDIEIMLHQLDILHDREKGSITHFEVIKEPIQVLK